MGHQVGTDCYRAGTRWSGGLLPGLGGLPDRLLSLTAWQRPRLTPHCWVTGNIKIYYWLGKLNLKESVKHTFWKSSLFHFDIIDRKVFVIINICLYSSQFHFFQLRNWTLQGLIDRSYKRDPRTAWTPILHFAGPQSALDFFSKIVLVRVYQLFGPWIPVFIIGFKSLSYRCFEQFQLLY